MFFRAGLGGGLERLGVKEKMKLFPQAQLIRRAARHVTRSRNIRRAFKTGLMDAYLWLEKSVRSGESILGFDTVD